MTARPFLVSSRPPGTVSAAVLIAHGGREAGVDEPGRLSLPALRMKVFARHLCGLGGSRGLAVHELRYRMTGFNDGSPVADVRWAIDEIGSMSDVPLCLVGHSMGSRASLQAAGAARVIAVAALAPWCPVTDSVDQLRDRAVMFIHGLNDRTTSPERSRAFALRTRGVTDVACRFELEHTGHAMIQRARLWHRLTTAFVLGVTAITPWPAVIADAMELAPEQACAVRI